jgi:hypothetical protein
MGFLQEAHSFSLTKTNAPETPYYYERSVRNVYDALERDFESSEQAEEKAKEKAEE